MIHTYIESREEGNYNSGEVDGGCIDANGVEHHRHLAFRANEECGAPQSKQIPKCERYSELYGIQEHDH